ncbi:MAG: tRNA (adenosine(37)-N6)-threonylcarbamoyltransferase complex dimerization subunit type 1 TsaB [Gammaproteobacteria bacterium]|nr:tRNA (adenosine(37)-N6)-threonylcarbamoyltransferase complex dimerization subunit type 1 TsaB [Gammaproteobacteria bacterium]
MKIPARILAIDTATEACSAALYIDGVITEQFKIAPREHTRLILKMIETLLDQSALKVGELDALAFGRGPGSFTGVRIATGIVQGLAFASDLPVVPISTLAALAQQTYDNHQQTHVLSAIDARMGEIYWACYAKDENNLMRLASKESVSAAESVVLTSALSNSWCGTGSGWASYKEQLEVILGDRLMQIYADELPRSSSIVKLAVDAFQRGEAIEASQALPVYLRNDVAKKKAEQSKSRV